jgi:hypothetical protein
VVDRSKLITTDGVLFDPALYEAVPRPLSAAEDGSRPARIPALRSCTGDGELTPAPARPAAAAE